MTKEEAIKLYETKWWEGKTDEEIAETQIHEERLICPFDVFHKAIETWLGRPVWTHEFADYQALIDEKQGKRKYEGVIESARRVAPDKPIMVVLPPQDRLPGLLKGQSIDEKDIKEARQELLDKLLEKWDRREAE